ncbi:TPA: hypothetical protein G9F27_005677 [Salmonella enterica]|uniref:Uncharacterized protein n=1 Tax=Salmonella enterica TaxID=28901 RepID=A0A743PGH2_SALER|nr:hypothetical protein [Salmonella enterica]
MIAAPAVHEQGDDVTGGISRTYCTRKMSQGKRHNQALIALAKRRCDVLSP